MGYLIQTRSKTGGETYAKHNRQSVLKLVQKLLDHGTKYYGEKLDSITVTRTGRDGKPVR
jgi:hypothetical protein